MKITAAVTRAARGPFQIETLDLEAPRAHEVRVKIAGVGLCHTDLLARDQDIPTALPAVMGHEGSGIVDAVGEGVTKVRPGDRVVLSFLSCGDCPRCDAHEPSYCHTFIPLNFPGTRPDGSTGLSKDGEAISGRFFGQSSFASHALAHERNVVKVEGDVPLELLGPFGCGFQTGAGGVMRSLACRAGSSIAIFGGGAVGMAAVLGARARGCTRIILVEPMARRRTLALELGATHALDPAAGDVAQAVRGIAPVGVDYAFDSTGIDSVMASTAAMLAPRGTVGLVAAAKPDSMFAMPVAALVMMGFTVKGIVEGDSDPDVLIPELVALYRAGGFPLEKLVKTWPLARIDDAIAAQHRGECVKAVLIP